MTRRLNPMLSSLAACATAGLFAASAMAAPSDAATATTNATYLQQRADCLAGRSPEDRATCLKETEAARAEQRQGRLDNGEDAAALARNAEARCKSVAVADREACLRMARGDGRVSGSVEGGGVLKEFVTRKVGPPTLVVPEPPARVDAPR